MKQPFAVAPVLLIIILILANASIVQTQSDATNPSYNVTTNWRGQHVRTGEPVTATARTTDEKVNTVEFRWLDPAGNLIWQDSVHASGPYVTSDIPDNAPPEIIDWAEKNPGINVWYAQNTQIPDVFGDWGVQALFHDSGKIRGKNSEIITIQAIMYKTEKVAAHRTIYIRPNGSIVPPTAPIQRNGDVYAFTDNIYETIVVQRDNIIVDGSGYTLQGAGSDTGFDLANRNNVTIRNTHITEWDYGIHVYNLSSRNTIADNDLTANVWRAIFLSNSSDNTLRDNNIVNNVREGIFLWLTNTTTVMGNDVSNNGEDGISVAYSSSNNNIINNHGFNNSHAGVSFPFEFSTGNTITGNNITQNAWAGIYISWTTAADNTFYHNNLDNPRQVFTVGATNTWDNGCEGNYWSDYPGTDSDGDGIGDTPHEIDETNQDNCPLMSPYIVGDVNHDGTVNTNDLLLLLNSYGAAPEDSNWNCHCDITGPEEHPDGLIDIYDLTTVGKNYGKTAEP